MMKRHNLQGQHIPMIESWRTHLEAAGLAPFARLLADGLRPLGPLAAQLLWLGQPALALFDQGSAADELAHAFDSASAGEPQPSLPATGERRVDP